MSKEQFTNEGTAGLWLPEKHLLRLTTLEVGWLWGILHTLDVDRGQDWPTAKPGENGEPIPTTMPRRIMEKLMELMNDS